MADFNSSAKALDALNTLEQTLSRGNLSGGTSIIMSPGDGIVSPDATSGTGNVLNLAGGDNTGGLVADTGGEISLQGGDANGGAGGGILLIGGDSTLAGGGSVTLTPGTGPGGDGLVFITRSGIQMIERAAVPGPAIAAGQARLWVRSDTPNVLVFTNDAGTDTVLGSGGGGGSLAATLGIGNTTGGNDIVLTTGDEITGEDSTTGGSLSLRAGNSSNSGTAGGDITLTGGDTASTGSGNGGSITLQGRTPQSFSGDGGSVNLNSGDGGTAGGNADAGAINLTGGDGAVSGAGGDINLTGGESVGAIINSGAVRLTGGVYSGSSGTGGPVVLTGGQGEQSGGDITIKGGTKNATGVGFRSGDILIESGDIGGTSGYDYGNITIRVPDPVTPGSDNVLGGSITIQAGATGTRNADGGDVDIVAGDTFGFNARIGGNINLTAGDENNGNASSVGGSIIMTPGTSDSGTDGRVQVLGTGTMEFLERGAAVGTPAAGRGYLWVRSDTPNVLVFTDDSGTDTVLGSGGGGGESLAATLAIGNTTGGTGIIVSVGDPMTFNENATVPGGTPGAGLGKLWVRSDTPNVLVFTDDAGTDTVLGTGGGETLAQTLVLGNTTSGTALEVSTGDPLTLNENTTVPGGAPSAGQGKIWVRDDAPNVLVFTDDTGVDTVLGAASGGKDPSAVYRGYSTSNVAFQSATWADVIGAGQAVTTFVDDEQKNITRSNSDFTFTKGGRYLAVISIVAVSPSGTHNAGLRLNGDINGILAHQINEVVGQDTVSLNQIIEVSDGEVVTIERANDGPSMNSYTNPTVNGQVGRTMNVAFISVERANDVSSRTGATIVANFTASAGDRVLYDPTGGTFTLDFPATALNGDRVSWKNVSADTTAVTLDGNGNNVEDPSSFALGSTATVSGDGLALDYEFSSAESAWILI